VSSIQAVLDDDTQTLLPAIVVGSLVGLGVLLAQPTSALPAVRIGPAPLVASGIGTVGGMAVLMVQASEPEAFGALMDGLSSATGRDDDQDGDQS